MGDALTDRVAGHNRYPDHRIDDRWIVSQRGPKNRVDPYKPCAFFTEKERMPSGIVEEVATLFLTNSECPFKCLMCDLWKNTTDVPVPPGAIPAQIEYALPGLPSVRHIKLYNSGSFFDPRAIPPEDHKRIAGLLEPFDTVIVESHPAFIGERTLVFSRMLSGHLQVALGLETVHPEILRRLNKKMTIDRFDKAVQFLLSHDIEVRAFILLKPPFMTEEEGVLWAQRSLDHAFSTGIRTCIIIPVREGNGALEALTRTGYFEPPDMQSVEKVLEYGIRLKKGLVFADLWDIQRFSACDQCTEQIKKRLSAMNLSQEIPPPHNCSCTDVTD